MELWRADECAAGAAHDELEEVRGQSTRSGRESSAWACGYVTGTRCGQRRTDVSGLPVRCGRRDEGRRSAYSRTTERDGAVEAIFSSVARVWCRARVCNRRTGHDK